MSQDRWDNHGYQEEGGSCNIRPSSAGHSRGRGRGISSAIEKRSRTHWSKTSASKDSIDPRLDQPTSAPPQHDTHFHGHNSEDRSFKIKKRESSGRSKRPDMQVYVPRGRRSRVREDNQEVPVGKLAQDNAHDDYGDSNCRAPGSHYEREDFEDTLPEDDHGAMNVKQSQSDSPQTSGGHRHSKKKIDSKDPSRTREKGDKQAPKRRRKKESSRPIKEVDTAENIDLTRREENPALNIAQPPSKSTHIESANEDQCAHDLYDDDYDLGENGTLIDGESVAERNIGSSSIVIHSQEDLSVIAKDENESPCDGEKKDDDTFPILKDSRLNDGSKDVQPVINDECSNIQIQAPTTISNSVSQENSTVNDSQESAKGAPDMIRNDGNRKEQISKTIEESKRDPAELQSSGNTEILPRDSKGDEKEHSFSMNIDVHAIPCDTNRDPQVTENSDICKDECEIMKTDDETPQINDRVESESLDSPSEFIRPCPSDNLKTDPIGEGEDEDSWDALFDDDGEALDPTLVEELTAAVGKVSVKKTQFDYYQFQPQETDTNYEDYGHLIEIYDFPTEFITRDLIMAFSEFMKKGFDIKWVDDTHAIGVFSSSIAASSAVNMKHPLLKVRPISEATKATKVKAKKTTEFLQPYKSRPETNASVARNLVAGALGLKSKVCREKQLQDRKMLREARDKKKVATRQKRDAWEGALGKCAMDEER